MLELIVVPYDTGRRSHRMGCGPEYLLASGLVEQLETAGLSARVATLETSGDALHAAFDLARQIASATSAAVQSGRFPIILAGNCLATLGAFAGLGSSAAVLWLDAHADFNTPDTSPSGFLDGMALAIITGRCCRGESAHVSGFHPLPDEELIMLGVRSVDAGEQPIVDGIAVVRTKDELGRALHNLKRDDLYLHVDLDVFDPTSLRANQFATDGGWTTAEVLAGIGEAARRKRITALAITAYDPQVDEVNAAPAIVLSIIREACA